mgnify:CR=1 FL=1
MINNNKNNSRVMASSVFQVSSLAAAMALVSSPAWAGDTIEFDYGLTMDWAVTTSYGIGVRTADQSRRLLSVNADDGNRNFDTGLVSEVFKITTDLEASYQNYGVFVRGTAFYDTQLMDKRNDYYDNNSPSQPSQSYPQDNHFTSQTRDIADVLRDVPGVAVAGVAGQTQIRLRGAQVTLLLTSSVFLGGVGLLAANFSVFAALNVMLSAFAVGTVTGSFTKLALQRGWV